MARRPPIRRRGRRFRHEVLIRNAHYDRPPQIPDDARRVFYFENCYREQWLAWIDRDHHIWFSGGDIGWEVYRLEQVNELILQFEEKVWLRLVQAIAASSRAGKDPPADQQASVLGPEWPGSRRGPILA